MTRNNMTMTEQGERRLRVTRWFNAAPELVYRAHMDPEIISKWMCPSDPGWTFELTDLGSGRMRYVWANGDEKMGMTAQILETDPPHRILHTEAFDEDWSGGETTCETFFRAQDGGTLLDLTITYQSAEGRAMALATPMSDGMRESYAALESMLAGAT